MVVPQTVNEDDGLDEAANAGGPVPDGELPAVGAGRDQRLRTLAARRVEQVRAEDQRDRQRRGKGQDDPERSHRMFVRVTGQMQLRKLLFVLPNLFTVSSIFCGF